ncbi:adenylosuccinate lyase [Gulosibacter molinativorax]|uniref:Adenylosuccinate lyase n=1 Tax=Gulosibacter molinativorax TaxID=256821 RepID=A0ABT7C965_9MICO|nr:adenylosuccinate lyase [Gulosibacter molinativorax]MDJ1371734.1 adenylosuccinate lyase [Gulosibacter molinativorax]QUY63156.1 Adenylosuccinate lyase [Gulosibacter molinativorax]
MSPLPPQSLSPLDNRYFPVVAPIGEHLSEAALNRARVAVEIEWLIYQTDNGFFGTEPISAGVQAKLRAVVDAFGQDDIDELGKIEATTRHDVKAVEYYVRARLGELGLSNIEELTHFGCTSEDINNTSYAITIRDAVTKVWLPAASALADQIAELAGAQRDQPMLSLTHGQPATPTTLGKELAVVAHRLRRVLRRIEQQEYLGKWAGATGNFAAHVAVAPEIDWEKVADEFTARLGLVWNPLTTQIESHDWQAELYSDIAHFNRILHNFASDIWLYISRGVFKQIPQPGATGSSTMPHKINPIRFENAESNLELSCAMLDSLAQTLVTSRLQRDLTDSSSQRNIGVGFGHSLLAIDNVRRGLGELDVNAETLAAELDGNWEVLAEAIQTVIRAEIVAGRSKIEDPYAVLKELTRGHSVGREELIEFVDGLDIGEDAKAHLRELTPATYTGRSSALVDRLS